MGNNNDRSPEQFVHVLKNMNQILETPEINSRFRFVKNRESGSARHDCGDLDPFQLSAGKTCVDFTVNIVLRAKTDLRKVITGFGDSNLAALRDGNQILYGKALKTDRLLKREADPALCSLGD